MTDTDSLPPYVQAVARLRASGRRQSDLAAQLGWSRTTVSAILAGRRVPSIDQAVALAREGLVAVEAWAGVQRLPRRPHARRPPAPPDTEPCHDAPGAP